MHIYIYTHIYIYIYIYIHIYIYIYRERERDRGRDIHITHTIQHTTYHIVGASRGDMGVCNCLERGPGRRWGKGARRAAADNML